MLKKSQVLNEGLIAALSESYELIYEQLIDIECDRMLEMLNESETQHWDEQRKLKALALWKILGDGQDYLKIYIDKGHQNGPEVHRCLTNGCVIVYNQLSQKIVTAMAKTPQEFKRYERQRGYEVSRAVDANGNILYDKNTRPNGTYKFQGEIMKNAQRAQDLGLDGWHPGENVKHDKEVLDKITNSTVKLEVKRICLRLLSYRR